MQAPKPAPLSAHLDLHQQPTVGDLRAFLSLFEGAPCDQPLDLIEDTATTGVRAISVPIQ